MKSTRTKEICKALFDLEPVNGLQNIEEIYTEKHLCKAFNPKNRCLDDHSYHTRNLD